MKVPSVPHKACQCVGIGVRSGPAVNSYASDLANQGISVFPLPIQRQSQLAVDIKQQNVIGEMPDHSPMLFAGLFIQTGALFQWIKEKERFRKCNF